MSKLRPRSFLYEKKIAGFVLCAGFYCVLLVLCFFFVPDSFFCFADEALEDQPVSVEDGQKMVVSDEIIEEEVEEDLKGLFNFRDPFLSALPKKVETKIVSIQTQTESVFEPTEVGPDEFDYSSLTITGLLWGGNKPVAIINNEIMGIGSQVYGATIIQIDAKGILFEYNDKQFLLQRSSGNKF
ncbi:MAG: hypothetical protein ABIC68_05820 [Candidatus Omnitrophota bacterium]